MKILHTVEFYPPSVGGMQEVVKQLSERLVQRGHDVTVATSKLPERAARIQNGVKIQEFAVSGNTVRGLSGEVEAYQRYLLNGDFDIITNFAAQQWATDAMLPILSRIKAKKILVPTGFSGLYLPEYKEYFASLRSLLPMYDMNVFLSHKYRDIDFARDAGVEKIMVIPNGAAEDEFAAEPTINIRAALNIPEEHILILTVGSHTGVKGHAEALQIFRKARIRRSTFLLVGNSLYNGCQERCRRTAMKYNALPPSLLARKRIIVREQSREHTVAAYHAADLFLLTSNIECSPLVLFEAMASRTPFLTTEVGNSAEIIEWSGGGRLLPTDMLEDGLSKARVDESAAILEEVVRSDSLRQEMAECGYRAWRERFTWEKIVLQYENLYHELISGKDGLKPVDGCAGAGDRCS